MVELTSPDSLDLAGYRRIVAGEAVVVSDAAYERVAAARAALERHLASGGTAYGVTTGLGYLTSAAIAETGPGSAPALAADSTRLGARRAAPGRCRPRER